MSLDSLFDQFIRERIYVKNVTMATREWYECAWRAFKASRSSPSCDADAITRADLTNVVVHLRERGVKPVSCNTWVRAMNAFCRWLHDQGASARLEKLPPQRLSKRLLATHDEGVLRLLLTFRPKGFREARIHALVATLLDTGCRIQELLAAKSSNFDFDQLLLTVLGKGRKERRMPFSTELRKVLFRYQQVKDRAAKSDLMFPAVGGLEWGQRNALRSYHCWLKSLGLPRSGFHRLRHTFATQYLKNGGGVVRLSIKQKMMRILLELLARGEMTMKELKVGLADALQLSDEDREARVPSGDQTVLANRVGWSRTCLGKAKLIESPRRGTWRLTDRGREALGTPEGPSADQGIRGSNHNHSLVRWG